MRNRKMSRRTIWTAQGAFVATALSTALLGCSDVEDSTDIARAAAPDTAESELRSVNAHEHILSVRLPPGIAPTDLRAPSRAVRTELAGAVRERFAAMQLLPASRADAIVVFEDETGAAVLPDLAARHTSTPDTMTAANDLTFTFDSPDDPWTPTEISEMSGWLNACYPHAKAVYGAPAFANTVNIKKENSSLAGHYYPSTNEIGITFRTPEVLCHEMIHAFRDDYVVWLNTYEEGMTRATEIETLYRAGLGNGTLPPAYYVAMNRPGIGGKGGDFWRGWIETQLRYELSSSAWSRAMLEKSTFFADFNAALYAQAATNPSVLSDEAALKAIAANAKPEVENTAFSTWYAAQHVLNTNPPAGNFVYIRPTGGPATEISVFSRDTYGNETNEAGRNVTWKYTSATGATLSSGTSVTNSFGLFFPPAPPSSATGRVTLSTTATVNGATVSSTMFFVPYGGNTIFGIVEGSNDGGTVTITPLDEAVAPVTLSVVNKAFEGANHYYFVRGRFRYQYTRNGVSRPAKVFTKGVGSYFLQVAP